MSPGYKSWNRQSGRREEDSVGHKQWLHEEHVSGSLGIELIKEEPRELGLVSSVIFQVNIPVQHTS